MDRVLAHHTTRNYLSHLLALGDKSLFSIRIFLTHFLLGAPLCSANSHMHSARARVWARSNRCWSVSTVPIAQYCALHIEIGEEHTRTMLCVCASDCTLNSSNASYPSMSRSCRHTIICHIATYYIRKTCIWIERLDVYDEVYDAPQGYINWPHLMLPVEMCHNGLSPQRQQRQKCAAYQAWPETSKIDNNRLLCTKEMMRLR